MEKEFKLNHMEKNLILIIREFDFLRKNGYEGSFFNIYFREQCVVFINKKLKQKMKILFEENIATNVCIKKYSIFSVKQFEVQDTFQYFNDASINYKSFKNTIDDICFYADFVQKHLMPVIRGEIWVDELIDKK